MSSQRVLGAPQSEAPCSQGEVLPLFVCPGVRDVPLDYALFPFGDGLSKPVACPGREICIWYAAFDLGGDVEFSDLPVETQLPPKFLTCPFSCPDFREHVGFGALRQVPRGRRIDSASPDERRPWWLRRTTALA